MEHKTPSRRRHSRQLKAQVLEQCQQPGASVAAVALAHGLNANLVHKWRRNAARLSTADTPTVAGFVALPIASTAQPPATGICIEWRRGGVTMNVIWPMATARECAHWLREVLR